MLFRPKAIYICNWGYHALSSKGQSICAGTGETVKNWVRKWYFSLKKRSRKKSIFPLLDAQKMSAHMRTLTQGSVAPEEDFSIHGMHYTLPQFAVKIQDSRSRPPPKYSHCVRMANYVEKIMPKSCRYIHIRGHPLIPWASFWPFLTTPSPTWASMSIWIPLSNRYVSNI